MKISDIYSKGADPSAGPARAREPEHGAEAAKPARGHAEAVKVQVSEEARALAKSGGMDAAKVERLKAAVEAGTFHVNERAIAEKIAASGG